MRALEASGNLSSFERPIVPLLVMAGIAVALLIAAHMFWINPRAAPTTARGMTLGVYRLSRLLPRKAPRASSARYRSIPARPNKSRARRGNKGHAVSRSITSGSATAQVSPWSH